MDAYQKIAYLIAKDARQKRITMVTTVIFVAAALAIIGLGVWISRLQQKNETLTNNNQALIRANELQDSVIKLQATLLKNFQDSISQNRLIEQQAAYIAAATEGGAHVPAVGIAPPLTQMKSQPGSTPGYLDTAMSIVDAAAKPATYTVYLQYAAGMKDALQQLQAGLRREKQYKVPGAELISNQQFPSSVRYFHEEDKDAAGEIATIARQASGLTFTLQKVSMRAPVGQLEVWIGDRK